MNKCEVRVLTIDDWGKYKEIRLSSLQDSPDSFGSTYVKEAQFSDDTWRSILDFSGRIKSALPLVVEQDNTPIGLAWGVKHGPNDDGAHLYQMWISPLVRGCGIGRLLIGKIMSWAKENSVNAILLEVTTSNVVAMNFYQSFGFKVYGEANALREGSKLLVQPMKLALT